MIEYLRVDVQQWLSRSLEAYYPIIFVDAIDVKVHRRRSVENEAFYVVPGVKEDKSRAGKPGRRFAANGEKITTVSRDRVMTPFTGIISSV